MAIVSVRNIKKTYNKGKVVALRDLSFDVEEGEIYGIIGPDGAGKTSLFRILTKYMEQGEFAAPGKPLFKVGNIHDMKLRAYITADQLTGLKIGQKVKVYADQGKVDRKEYQGTVTWISSKAEFTPKTIQTRDERANLVYAVKIAVKNDGLIKEGMYGDVRF